MKNWSVIDLVLFMFGAAIFIDLVVVVAAPAILGLPTTEENRELRKEMIGMLKDISIALIAIIALKYKEIMDHKSNNNDRKID